MRSADSGMRDGRPDQRQRRILRASAFQVLWALLLVYIILTGLAILFGREVGYDISFGVCGGLALLVTVTFAVIYVLDRVSAAGNRWLQRIMSHNNERELH